jgi:hypothetical protein
MLMAAAYPWYAYLACWSFAIVFVIWLIERIVAGTRVVRHLFRRAMGEDRVENAMVALYEIRSHRHDQP